MNELKTACFDVNSAGCLGCKLAIEHAGKRLRGVRDIEFDIATHRINVQYEAENGDVPEKIGEIVEKIGYEARLVESK
jgi:cation transport ATPase